MLRTKVKKLFSIAIALSLAVGLTACGGNTNTSKEGEIVINFPSIWVGKDSKAKVIDEIVTQFNEENAGEIKVVVEEIADYDAYESKMKTNIAAGAMPDVFTFKAGSIAEPYYKSGKLMDLTKYMDEGWKDDFIDSSMEEATYNDQILAVPYEFAVTPAMYNAKLLSEAGYDSFPETYDEFFEMCEALKANGVAPTSQMTADNAWTSMLWYSQIVASIGGADVYERGLDDPAFLEAAKIMQKLFENTTSDAVGANASVAAGHFLNNRTAILLNGPWFIGRLESEGVDGLYDNVEIAPTPNYEGGEGGKGGYVGFVQALIGAGKQEDPAKEEAVVKFLKTLTDPENVKKLSMDSGSMFVVKTELEDGDEIERLQGQMIEQSNAAPYVAPHFNMSVAPSVASEFPHALSSLVLGESTPEEFIEQLKNAE